jgi:alpha-tubulin suppressor-like RCC1 family protein
VWALGGNRDGDLGQGDLRPHNGLLKVKNIGRIVDIASHTAAALDEKGKLWVWGGNIYWRPDLAGGNRSKEPYPIHISTKKPIKFIEGAFAIAMGMTNGEVYFMRQERVGIRGTGKPSPQDESTGHLLTPEKSLWTWK